jgi:sulfide:quinone oxidoreductase
MSQSPLRVFIAGGGVAGLETLMALRSLAGDRVELTLIAPEDEFVYRPLAAKEPYAVGRMRRVPLDRAAHDAEAEFVAQTIETVDAEGKVVTTSDGREREYDALVLAVGATPMPVFEGTMIWDDRSDADMLGGLLQDIEHGYSRTLAVVIPPGPGWPLRAYELALVITREATDMAAELQTTIITPEPAPLALLGSHAVELMSKQLEREGIGVVAAAHIDIERGHVTTIVLQPSGQRLEVDRVLALPALRGRPVAGIPVDSDGFIEVDEHCRVRDLDGVWAAGDGTAFPMKSGGFAAEQANVVAEDIAAAAGAAIEPRTFDPVLREDLAGPPAARFLMSWIGEGDDDALTTQLPAVGVPLLTYLERDLAVGWRGNA